MIDKEAQLKNLEWMANTLLKIASNKNLSLDKELKLVSDLKEAYFDLKEGVELESAKGAPGSLFNVETAPHVVKQLQSFLNAPYINAQISTLGGEEHVSIILTISADPKEKWTNDIMQNSRYGNFSIDNDGTVEQFSGGFSKWKQPNNAMRKTHVKSVQQLVDVLNKFMAKVNSPVAPATPSIAPAPKLSSLNAPVTEPTKLLVFKREFLATPLQDQKVFGGYDISQNGKKLFKINAKNSQPMSKEQLEFCAQIELTRGLKQAKLVEKIAFLEAGTKVYVIATDKSGKRTKFASLDQGIRGWVPSSKIKVLALESQTVQHNGHPDKVLGQTSTQTLVDCSEGGPMWVSSTELMDENRPPATPESLNDLESKKDCSTCHGKGRPERGSCPECGIYSSEARDKEALQTALPPTIPNQRGYLDNPVEKTAGPCTSGDLILSGPTGLACANCGAEKGADGVVHHDPKKNPQLGKQAAGCDSCSASMINGVFCHETGCPNKAKEDRIRQQNDDLYDMEMTDIEREGSLNKRATVTHREDGWHVLSEKGKNLGGPYKSKAEAVKRLRQVEYWKNASYCPNCKKIEYER